MNKMKGFTLIELMIVIAILGILLAIAIPAYQDYTVRTRTSECFNLQAPVKLTISEFYISNGSMPAAGTVEMNRTSEYCNPGVYTRVARDHAQITVNVEGSGVGTPGGVDFQGAMDGYGCFDQNGDVEWTCNYAGVVDGGFTGRFLPASCRNLVDPGPAQGAGACTGTY